MAKTLEKRHPELFSKITITLPKTVIKELEENSEWNQLKKSTYIQKLIKKDTESCGTLLKDKKDYISVWNLEKKIDKKIWIPLKKVKLPDNKCEFANVNIYRHFANYNNNSDAFLVYVYTDQTTIWFFSNQECNTALLNSKSFNKVLWSNENIFNEFAFIVFWSWELSSIFSEIKRFKEFK